MRHLPLHVIVVVYLAAFVGCAAEIGDACTTNLECSPNGDRICDISQRDGYCTVQGCTFDGCPEDSVCVAFYPTELLSQACDPKTEDAVGGGVTATDACVRGEICLSSGVCARPSLESRFCMQLCGSDGDCRGGYECREVGEVGSEPVLDPAATRRHSRSFCAQR